jgi:fumarylacetoacetate (FAA) hydrolase family protein
MIRALSLTAALALLPLSSALAQNAASQNAASQSAPARGVAHDPDSAEARLEAAADAFEARMEAFGKRAEAISEDPNLSESARGQSIAALWSAYAPDVAAFTAEATRHASELAAEALKDIDVDALVEDALNDPEVKRAMEEGVAAGTGIARNSAWTNPDPEQMVTYGLIAQYAMDQAADAVVAEEEAEDVAPIAPPEPPQAPQPPAT